MEVRKGYKQTEVGVIPFDWELPDLESLCSKLNVGFVGVCEPYFTDEVNGILLIRTGNLQGNNLILEGARFVTKDFHQRNPKSKVIEGDILIARHGSSGNAVIVPKIVQEANTLNIVVLRSDDKKVYKYYLAHVINSESVRSQAIHSTAGSTQGVINTGEIAKLKIPLPPTKSEQTAIATALSDADALITGLEKLIEKKRAIKQGAMQKLLSESGFAGFKDKQDLGIDINPENHGNPINPDSDKWEVKKLGEIADILTGFPFPSSGYSKSGIRLLRGSNIKRGNTDWNEDICQYWPKLTAELLRYQLNCGDIVVAMDGSLVGKSFAQLSQIDLPAILLQRVARIRSTVIDINYLKELVCSEIFTGYCDSVKTSSAIPHISPADIYNYPISYPSEKSEQTRIATILSDMDAEITALEQKLAKYKQIKQGMMQELLTGRIRLVEGV